MKTLPFFLILFLIPGIRGEELPWMGVSLGPASREQRQKLGLAEGIGFRVSQLVSGGPLAQAKGKKEDVWWKFDGQILINKEQMLVLLRSKAAGDTIPIDFFRDGKSQTLKLVLGTRPRPRYTPIRLGVTDAQPKESRVLAKRERVARVILGQRELSLRSEGDLWRFQAKRGETLMLSALVSATDFRETLPAKWHEPFMILSQTLQRKKSGDETQKRVRFIPSEGKSSDE